MASRLVSSRGRLAACVAVAATVLAPSVCSSGAPRDGDRFVNLEARHVEAGAGVTVPFFLRKAWTSMVPRAGAAARVPFDQRILAGPDPTITWIGHSTMLVRMGGMAFLTDPMFSQYATPVPLLGPGRLVEPGASLEQIGHVDFATLSHNHYDHTDIDSIRALAAKGTRFIVPLGLGALVREAGGEATELDWWEQTEIGGLTVYCVPAQHFSRRGLTDGDKTLWAGWVVAGSGKRFYHAGDTGYFSGLAEIGRRMGPIDLAAIPIGAYEPAAMMHSVHLNPEEAIRAAIEVGASHSLAMHYGTFDLADEPVDEPPRRFAAEAARQGLGSEKAWLMKIGETRSW